MAPGLTVAGWFVGGIISKLITELVECGKDHKKKLGLEDELKRLKKQLPKIEAVVSAVDDHALIREKNRPLDDWLWQLRDAADQAEDVMVEMEYILAKEKVEGKRNKVSKAISNVKTFLERFKEGKNVDNHPVLKRLREVVKEIDEVAADTEEFYTLVKDMVKKQSKVVESVTSNRQTSSVLKVRTLVFGRENEKSYIVSRLLNPEYKTKEANFAILPLIGAGGIGKTTLAQCVYNDPKVEKHFELRMWICISNNFDVFLITKKLYESAFKESANFDNLDSIHTQLVNKLKTKRFLVVFDDAWNDNDGNGWDTLFAPLKHGEIGSMILLTTREKTVAESTGPNLMDPYLLPSLDEDDMWDLFKACAFGNEDPMNHQDLVEIGKEIVDNMIKGSPLAAETVGAILRSKLNREHWISVLNSELWSLPQGPNDIMPALKLTYQYLPSHLKPCFSFCSIFPQDYVFIKHDLINMWIALGLVPREFNAKEKPEDVGSKYFQDLLDRSIFNLAQDHNYYNGERPQTYIMHDLMHDLSASVAQGECCRCDIKNLESVPSTVRHLFIYFDFGDCYEFKLSKSLKNVRTLILQFNALSNANQGYINELVEKLTNLRVLVLFNPAMIEFSKSIGHLLHLRYLSLMTSWETIFPQSVPKLYLLETLVCDGYEFNGRSDDFVNLINLRHLIASKGFIERIANIGKLTSLQELSFNVGRDSGFEICQLKDMRELRDLSISNINVVDSHEKVIEAKLRDKHSLRKLRLKWGYDEKVYDAKKFHEKVFDNLEPHSGLKELIIKDYPGGRPPVWCNDQSSTSESLPLALEKLTIKNCKELELPYGYLNKFSSLRKLDIINCPKINQVAVALFLPSPSICINGSYVNLNVDGPHELSLQPTLQKDKALLFVIDCPDSVRFLRMRDHYTGKWPPIWFTQNLSMLEHLSIDGEGYVYSYSSHGLPNSLNQLLSLVNQTRTTDEDVPCIPIKCQELVQPSNMVELEQFYFTTQHIKQMQCLKELIVNPIFSKSCVMPPLPFTLKELILSHLGLQVIPNLYIKQSTELERLPSLVALEIYMCPNLVSLAEGLLENPEQFPALKEVNIAYCKGLMHLPEDFSGFTSLKILEIKECSMLCAIPPLPLTLEELTLYGLRIHVIPNLYENQSKQSGRLSSLTTLRIFYCKNLVSLAEGLLQNPEQFPALKKVQIACCEELACLPEGGFNGFLSLRKLGINYCPKLPRQLPHTTETGFFPWESFQWYWNGANFIPHESVGSAEIDGYWEEGYPQSD